MSLPVVNVTGTVVDLAGNAVAGAQVTVKLSGPDLYQHQYVTPTEQTFTADAGGAFTLPIFPNALGELNTFYTVKLKSADGATVYRSLQCVVPNSATTLDAIEGTGPATPSNTLQSIEYATNLPFWDQTVKFLSLIKNYNTAVRNYIFPDVSGTVLLLAGAFAAGMVNANADGTLTSRTLTGTANQVVITNGDGASGNPTFALPQNIHSAATPTFAGMTLTGALAANGGITVPTGQSITGAGTAAITGFASIAATSFSGALTGDVTGNVTGNLTGNVTGNASTATALQTARAINGVNFDGTAAITVTAAAGTLTGTTLAANVVASSLTSVGTLTSLTTSGDATIGGNLTVNGTTTYVNTANMNVTDSLVKFATGNAADIIDEGFYAVYQPSATPLYAGLFRDATDGVWKLFDSLQVEPTTTVDTAGTGYAAAALKVGAFTATGSSTLAGMLTSSAGGEAAKFIATSSGTYGSQNYLSFYRADGTTRKSYIGYGSNDSTIMRLALDDAAASFIISANGHDLTFDASGNLGLGVTPSAWRSIFNTVQVGNGAVFAGRNDGAPSVAYYGANWYVDASSSARYIASDYATKVTHSSNGVQWQAAASGTAGGVITWLDMATLGVSGFVSPFAISLTSGGSSVINTNGNGVGTDHNAAVMILGVRADSVTGRSIGAGGTIAASGADYAEYERKSSLSITLNKGDIVGFDGNGELVLPSNAVTFGVKSTSPSLVGGDVWGGPGLLASDRPKKPSDDAPQEVKDKYALDVAAFDAKLEAARQWVDRIAYSGKVPVNVMGAQPGNLIVADNGGEAWDLTGDASVPDWFKKYLRSVGRVRRILPDGRAEIAVYVH